MDVAPRIEKSLQAALDRMSGPGAPPTLAAAARYGVFPGGARIRPRLCLEVARACGDENPLAADSAAAAIELFHCASLVHDDLPAFDDAAFRRGKASVHKVYGEAQAILVGDALIVAAFETLAFGAATQPQLLPGLVQTIVRATGMPHGIIAGQAFESETSVDLAIYHRAKTGSLFEAATISGAIASGARGERWRELGAAIGEAFQVADDLKDEISSPGEMGKPSDQDKIHGRPNAVRELGVSGALKRLRHLVEQAVASIPSCPGRQELEGVIHAHAKRLVPSGIERFAA